MTVKLLGVDVNWWTFPAGERGVRILDDVHKNATIVVKYESSTDLIDMCLLVNALRHDGVENITCEIPYFPYARQDRVSYSGESFSLQVAAQIVNSCNFTKISILDPHSDVLAGMFAPGVLEVIEQWHTLYSLVESNGALISPDAGALKKIYPLAKAKNMPVIEASKKRDPKTGEISGTSIDLSEVVKYDTLYVVDDICDGGRTFIELGKEIRKAFTGTLKLVVTHGIFSKGMEVFDGIYDDVRCYNDMRKNK